MKKFTICPWRKPKFKVGATVHCAVTPDAYSGLVDRPRVITGEVEELRWAEDHWMVVVRSDAVRFLIEESSIHSDRPEAARFLQSLLQPRVCGGVVF